MSKKMKGIVLSQNMGLELDPKLWQNLPDDLLVSAIAKLPFLTAVALRRVCKLWHLDIIPRAAPLMETSNRSTLLYFDFLNHNEEKPKAWNHEESRGSLWWMEIGKAKSKWMDSMNKFQQISFPSLSNDEVLKLRICEKGLLFFALMKCVEKNCKHSTRCVHEHIVREIVVCNPLTSQSKILGLPFPLRPICRPYPGRQTHEEVLMGSVFDSKTGSYCLVVAGEDIGEYTKDKIVTLLYDSLTCSWTNGKSLISALLEVDDGVRTEGVIDVQTGQCKVVSRNNNLYWFALVMLGNSVHKKEFVLKFHFHGDTGGWEFIPIPNVGLVYNTLECRTLIRSSQIAFLESELLLWHVHYQADRDAHHMSRPCCSGLKLEVAPEIKWIQQNMVDKVDVLLGGNDDFYVGDYMAFGHEKVIYHVVKMGCSKYRSLKIIAYDKENHCYKEWIVIPKFQFISSEFALTTRVWIFSASLTASP